MTYLEGARILAAANPLDHVVDKPLIQSGDLWWVSNVTVMLVVAGVLTALIMIYAARRITTGSRRTLDDFRTMGVGANLVEVICLYLRDTIFRPVLGEQTDKYTPTLWTFFWFILICNLLGLLPLADLTAMFNLGHHGHGIGGTATQSLWVTGALALLAFVFYTSVALLKDPIGYFKHLTGGAPPALWVIMVPVEILGTIIKPFALALRLFANMTGGHILLAVLLSFIPGLIKWSVVGYGLAILPLIGMVLIYMLELLVAFIQAFVFTFLTCVFLGQLVVHAHEHEHGDQVEGHHAEGAAA